MFSNAKVHAISTARTFKQERPVLEGNMNILNGYINTRYTFENLEFSEEYICGGYAKYNDELITIIKECISKEGMLIDPTYSGKAFWGMINTIKKSSVYDKKCIVLEYRRAL